MIIKLPKQITNIMAHIISHGYKAYVIGGAVRDFKMNFEPHDYDIFTNAKGEELLKMFPEGNVIGGEERQEKILTVMVAGVEVSTFRLNGDRTEIGNNLEDHQKTCDFLMNAIACDINGVIDKNNKINEQGLNDIAENRLKFVGNAQDRIDEDPLRVLRGIRFILKYNMMCDKNTLKILLSHDVNVPKERIREELMKILSLELASSFLKYIARFLPKSIIHFKAFLPGGHWHNETPYAHAENSFLEMSKVTNDPLLRMVALLHDNGKSDTRTEEDGVVHFYEHHKVGADNVKEWMNEYKFSSAEIKYVTTFIYNHMHGYTEQDPSKKSYLKLFVALDDAGITIEEYVMQLYADNQGNLAKPRIKFGDFIKDNVYIKKYYELKFTKEPFKISDLEISGKDLITKYGFKQGKELGMLLKEIFRLVQEGDLKNIKADIHHFVKTKTKINAEYGKETSETINTPMVQTHELWDRFKHRKKLYIDKDIEQHHPRNRNRLYLSDPDYYKKAYYTTFECCPDCTRALFADCKPALLISEEKYIEILDRRQTKEKRLWKMD